MAEIIAGLLLGLMGLGIILGSALMVFAVACCFCFFRGVE